MMANQSQARPKQPQTYHLEDADEWVIKRRYKNRTPFTSISLIRTDRTRDYPLDILDHLGELSKPARDLFLDIKVQMDFTTYIAVLPSTNLTQSQKTKRSQAIRELENTGTALACRVPRSGLINASGIEQKFKPSTFMLSPEYIYPSPKHKEEILNIWDQCKTTKLGRTRASP